MMFVDFFCLISVTCILKHHLYAASGCVKLEREVRNSEDQWFGQTIGCILFTLRLFIDARLSFGALPSDMGLN